MTTLRETFAEDLAEEARLRESSEASFDYWLNKKRGKREQPEPETPPTEILQKQMVEEREVLTNSKHKRARIHEVHNVDSRINQVSEGYHYKLRLDSYSKPNPIRISSSPDIDKKSVLGRMLEHNKRSKVKSGFSPRKGVYHVKKRNKPRWSRFVKYG